MNDEVLEYDFNKGRGKNILKFIATLILIALWALSTYVITYSVSAFVSGWFSTPMKTLPFETKNEVYVE